jgi:hypothetical protein
VCVYVRERINDLGILCVPACQLNLSLSNATSLDSCDHSSNFSDTNDFLPDERKRKLKQSRKSDWKEQMETKELSSCEKLSVSKEVLRRHNIPNDPIYLESDKPTCDI